MEIRIGVQNVSREIVLESDLSLEELSTLVSTALSGTILELAPAKGGRIIIPTQAIGYLEAGSEEKRRVGFGV